MGELISRDKPLEKRFKATRAISLDAMGTIFRLRSPVSSKIGKLNFWSSAQPNFWSFETLREGAYIVEHHAEKDAWANLFDYMGSDENVRLRFAIDKIGVTLDEASIIFGDSLNAEAWDRFISSLKKEGKKESEPVIETPVPELAPDILTPSQKRKFAWPIQYRWIGLISAIGILAAIAAIWKPYLSSGPLQVASVEPMKHPLPEQPSIAVLPFVNMSEDPKQEFFSDGMTDEIITALTKVPHLFVISRQSTFTYKGKQVSVKKVSEELGVRYVLEGSVHKSVDRIRINAQLIDAFAGHHIWAERYERDLEELFSLQDEITMKILTGIQVKLTAGEGVSGAGKYFKGKQGLDCYLKIMEGYKYIEGHNIEDIRAAGRIAEEAVAICPEIPQPYVLLGYVHQMEYWTGSGKSRQDSIEKGLEVAQKALALDDSNAGAHGLLGNYYSLKREYAKAIAEGEKALALAPGSGGYHIWHAMNLTWAGRSEDAIPLFQKALRLNPVGTTGLYLNFGIALRCSGRFEEAVWAFQNAVQRSPDNILAHINLAATYSMLGHDQEAHSEAAEVLRINPKFLVDPWQKRQIYRDQSVVDKLVDALHKVGLK